MGNTVQKYVYPGPYPETYGTPSFDPHFGFSGERKERVMPVPEEVLIAAKVPKSQRDYCAHLLLDYLACYTKEFPFVNRCKAEVHNYQVCEYEDQVLRMKEYERERRLLKREQRRQNALKAQAA